MSRATDQTGQQDVTVRIYGNRDLPEGTPDRPLVTFALFTYNQEQYIREAVEGAFAQTYSPLEILLSDDCSTDRTFEIMEEMASEYNGPHLIKLRRNEINLETAAHFSIVNLISVGALIVVAAGDDISQPARTETLASTWRECGKTSGIYHSNIFQFNDKDGIEKAIPRRPESSLSKHKIKERLFNGKSLLFFAQSFMYTRDFLLSFPPLLGGSIIEDGPMIYRCALVADFIYVDKFLVYARMGILNSGMGIRTENPSHWNRLLRSRIMSAFNTLSDISYLCKRGIDCDPQISSLMAKKIRRLSKFILPESTKISPIHKLQLAVKIMLLGLYQNPRDNLSIIKKIFVK